MTELNGNLWVKPDVEQIEKNINERSKVYFELHYQNSFSFLNRANYQVHVCNRLSFSFFELYSNYTLFDLKQRVTILLMISIMRINISSQGRRLKKKKKRLPAKLLLQNIVNS